MMTLLNQKIAKKVALVLSVLTIACAGTSATLANKDIGGAGDVGGGGALGGWGHFRGELLDDVCLLIFLSLVKRITGFKGIRKLHPSLRMAPMWGVTLAAAAPLAFFTAGVDVDGRLCFASMLSAVVL